MEIGVNRINMVIETKTEILKIINNGNNKTIAQVIIPRTIEEVPEMRAIIIIITEVTTTRGEVIDATTRAEVEVETLNPQTDPLPHLIPTSIVRSAIKRDIYLMNVSW